MASSSDPVSSLGLGDPAKNFSAPHVPILATTDSGTAPAVSASATAPNTSWAKVASRNPIKPQPLKFVEPIFTDDNSTISIPFELIAIGREKYSLCLIGQFLGSMPKMGLIHAVFNKLWGREVLWPWSSTLQKVDSSSAIFPVWVQMQNVPLELLTHDGLSYLASAIGKPLHADQDSSQLFRSDCAKVSIEVDFSKPLKNETVVDKHGEKVTIPLSYSWKPQHCSNCKGWGHHELTCKSKKIVTKWVPKATLSAAAAAPVGMCCTNTSPYIASKIESSTAPTNMPAIPAESTTITATAIPSLCHSNLVSIPLNPTSSSTPSIPSSKEIWWCRCWVLTVAGCCVPGCGLSRFGDRDLMPAVVVDSGGEAASRWGNVAGAVPCLLATATGPVASGGRCDGAGERRGQL
ncbi:hypothetical protein Tsubulata_001225 [Turnera subulata]|uniref:DUF4283 domain-containing protein n=1 Tax=Turnera subulata TaxID=218843 RepID=A0A9Q0J2L8_9ROSI|nr:hypothetical protein Tsubulata_001225 [Turnera subulata]